VLLASVLPRKIRNEGDVRAGPIPLLKESGFNLKRASLHIKISRNLIVTSEVVIPPKHDRIGPALWGVCGGVSQSLGWGGTSLDQKTGECSPGKQMCEGQIFVLALNKARGGAPLFSIKTSHILGYKRGRENLPSICAGLRGQGVRFLTVIRMARVTFPGPNQ